MSEMDLSDFEDARDSFDEQEDGPEPEWVDLSAMEDGDVLGPAELVRTQEDAGDYDSRLYELDTGDERPALFWGNATVDSQIDAADVTEGDLVVIERDGSYENKYGEFPNFNVKFKRQ